MVCINTLYIPYIHTHTFIHSDALMQFLTGETLSIRAPGILELPQTVFSTPMGQMIRPMFEQMQAGINNDTSHSFDPFGGGMNQGNNRGSITPPAYPNQNPPVPSYQAVRMWGVHALDGLGILSQSGGGIQ